MNRATRRNSWVLAAAFAGILAVGTAIADNGTYQRRGPGRPDGPRGPMREVLSQLDLSDEQKAGIKEIFQSQRPIVGPLSEQTAAARRGLFQAIHAPALDEAAVRAASDQLSKAQLALALERARTVARVRELLTPEQRKTLDSAREQRMNRAEERGHRMRNMMHDGLDDSNEPF